MFKSDERLRSTCKEKGREMDKLESYRQLARKAPTSDLIGRRSWIAKALVTTVPLVAFSISPPSSGLASEDALPKTNTGTARITVEADPRVELIGIVFRLAGNPEFNGGVLRSYVKDIERHFGDFDDHPAVKLATNLRSTRKMSCDGPMSLAVHIDRDFRPRKSFEQWPWRLDSRWEKRETEEFLDKLQQFAADTRFNQFFEAHGSFYGKGIRSCEDIMAQANLEEWLDEFFGLERGDDLKLVLGFTGGFSNYGIEFADEKTSEKYAIIGMHLFNSAGDPVFRPKQLVTTAHEFCHSFTNPTVEKHMDRLRPAGEKMYAANASGMRRIGYQKWESLMYETAVRGCVANFVRKSFPPMFIEYYLKDEVGDGFVWTKELGDLLQEYESNRDKYATFESFFPEIVTFLNEYANKG
jgi:hypothetical protein